MDGMKFPKGTEVRFLFNGEEASGVVDGYLSSGWVIVHTDVKKWAKQLACRQRDVWLPGVEVGEDLSLNG